MSASEIRTIVAAWETPYTRDVWDVLQEKKTNAQTHNAQTHEEMELLSFGPVLPDDEEDRVAHLTVHVRREENESAERQPALYWTLVVRQPPSGEPPENVKEDNRKLEGRRGLMKLFERCIVGVPPVASLRLTMNVAGAAYGCRILPREISRGGEHDIAANLSQTSRLEQVGYRFEGSPYGLEEMAIIYDHEDDVFIVSVRASGILRLGSRTWLPYAEEVADVVLKAFFSRRGTE